MDLVLFEVVGNCDAIGLMMGMGSALLVCMWVYTKEDGLVVMANLDTGVFMVVVHILVLHSNGEGLCSITSVCFGCLDDEVGCGFEHLLPFSKCVLVGLGI